MSNRQYWTNYKKRVAKSMGDFGIATGAILAMGLGEEIGELFALTKRELIGKVPKDLERKMELGDILWYIAAIEIYYKLPSSLSTNLIGQPIEMNTDHDVDLLETYTDLMHYAADIGVNIGKGDTLNLQYNLNHFFSGIYDFCIFYNINTKEGIKANLEKIDIRHKESFKKDPIKDHEKEAKATAKAIKNLNQKEIMFDIKLDNRSNNPYKGVKLKGYNSVTEFESGDLITDFFRAVCHMDKIKDEDYSINYSGRFRNYLTENESLNIESGFIVGEELLSAMVVVQSQTLDNGTVSLGDEARPTLMKKGWENLNQLLDHVAKFENKK
jgi:hypothetical protein